jgi:hypothetical protein
MKTLTGNEGYMRFKAPLMQDQAMERDVDAMQENDDRWAMPPRNERHSLAAMKKGRRVNED